MEFQHNKASALDWLSDFYKQCGYGGQYDQCDDVYYVLNNDSVVGVVRVAKEHGVYILRGMQVLPSNRGNHIGRQLLMYLNSFLKQSTESCFCLPHDHLKPFYTSIGFKCIANDLAPEFIRLRIEQYLTQGLDICLMVKT